MTRRAPVGAVAGVGVLTMLALVASPGRVLASCAMPPPIVEALAKAEIVFVGTVLATTERNMWATVTVEEVWRGPDLPQVVEVRGGGGGDVSSSIDREFGGGVTYLFAPTTLQNGILTDNSCTATRQWEDALAALRPSDARGPIGGSPPAPAGFDFGAVLGPIGVALWVAGVLLVVGLAAHSRQAD